MLPAIVSFIIAMLTKDRKTLMEKALIGSVIWSVLGLFQLSGHFYNLNEKSKAQ
jgi:hypothetical protein